MTAAYRLKGLGWFGGVVIVSLGFYLVSLQVAAERKRLVQMDVKIRAAERDIRALETEFDVRANLVQLERWNGDVLALVAPSAGQFVRDEGALASISFDRARPASARTAAMVVPSLPPLSDLSQPLVIDEAPAAKPAVMVAVAPAIASRPARPAIVKTAAVAAAAPVATVRSGASRHDESVAMLDRTLLSDSTLGDLLSGARAERRRLR